MNTPITDAFAIKFKTPCGEKYWVPVDIARKLERERDEARATCGELVTDNDAITLARTVVRITQERDEARAEMAAIKAMLLDPVEVELDMIRGNIAIPARPEFGGVYDTGKAMANLIRQRDEARADAARWGASSDTLERAGAEQCRRADKNREWALKAEKERDEARENLEAERALADRLALQLKPLLIFTWRDLPPTKAELAFYAWEEARQSLTLNQP